ncbi:MAG: hypothetical protein BM565_11440 [Gammaproteobacteria bacterium MedPE]|nr:MAG: hypothetical protein BM565_11440 [Gammaproteobacteria bacterium MedPE]
MWPIKLLFIILFLFVLISLFQALNIMRKEQTTVSMSQFIGRRLIYSALLLILIILAMAFGLITPNPRPY